MVDQPESVLLEMVEMDRDSICIGKLGHTPNVGLQVDINRITRGETL